MVAGSASWRRVLAYGSLYFIWGTTYPAIRLAVRSLPPFFMSGSRHLVAGLILLSLARFLRQAPWPGRREWLGGALMGTFFLGFGNGLASWGVQYVESGLATLLSAGVPLLVLLFGWLFKGRKVLLKEGALLVLGLLGVLLLLKPSQGSSPRWIYGMAALVFAVLVWSLVLSEMDRFPMAADGVMAAATQMLGGGLILLLVSPLFEKLGEVPFKSLPGSAWAIWAYLVAFGSCVGYISFNWLLRHEPPHLASTYNYVNPIVALFLGWRFLGEELGLRSLLASVLVILSVAGLLSLKAPMPAPAAK